MFDLRANFTIKVTGKEDSLNFVAKSERTFFLCVDHEVLTEILDKFPKAKFICYKRALKRRKVFMEHYEKLEDYLKAKEETSSKLKAMRMMGIPIAISPPKTSYVNS